MQFCCGGGTGDEPAPPCLGSGGAGGCPRPACSQGKRARPTATWTPSAVLDLKPMLQATFCGVISKGAGTRTRGSCLPKASRHAEGQSRTLSAFRKFLPLFDRVLVERLMAETVTKGGIMLPEKSQGKVLQATVVAVGPGS
uniref:10 kDa heat shock protein, mitochondrial n=1 Tax=Oryzias sinensis TaxID=183150 RepID=A0A8C7WY75_9TELE